MCRQDESAPNNFKPSIWLKRHEDYIANVKNFDGQIAVPRPLVEQYKSDVVQVYAATEARGRGRELYPPLLAQGYVSKLQLMTATDNRTEMSRLLADARNLVDSNSQTMAALKAQRDAYIQKWHSDTGTQLVTDRNDLDLTRDSLDEGSKAPGTRQPRCTGGRDRAQGGQGVDRIGLQRRRSRTR